MGQHVQDPLIERRSAHTTGHAVPAGLEPEVVAIVGAWLDVAPVDADRRRAQKPLANRGIVGADPSQRDPTRDAAGPQELLKMRQ
jgi:hypothetical protein